MSLWVLLKALIAIIAGSHCIHKMEVYLFLSPRGICPAPPTHYSLKGSTYGNMASHAHKGVESFVIMLFGDRKRCAPSKTRIRVSAAWHDMAMVTFIRRAFRGPKYS